MWKWIAYFRWIKHKKKYWLIGLQVQHLEKLEVKKASGNNSKLVKINASNWFEPFSFITFKYSFSLKYILEINKNKKSNEYIQIKLYTLRL